MKQNRLKSLKICQGIRYKRLLEASGFDNVIHRLGLATRTHFLLHAPQCPCSVRKRFSRDHSCRGRSKPGCRIVDLTDNNR